MRPKKVKEIPALNLIGRDDPRWQTAYNFRDAPPLRANRAYKKWDRKQERLARLTRRPVRGLPTTPDLVGSAFDDWSDAVLKKTMQDVCTRIEDDLWGNFMKSGQS